jgi:hypothetical protein
MLDGLQQGRDLGLDVPSLQMMTHRLDQASHIGAKRVLPLPSRRGNTVVGWAPPPAVSSISCARPCA